MIVRAQSEIREDVEERLLDLLPYILSGRYLKRQPFYVIHTVHSYSRDVVAVLVGLGIGIPGAKIFSDSHADLSKILSHLPSFEWIPALALIVCIAVLKVYVTRESVERRAHLVEQCETDFDLKFIEIQQALEQRNPVQRLTSIRNSVTTLVTHHTRARSYTFRGGWAVGADIEAREQAKQLCDSNERRWR